MIQAGSAATREDNPRAITLLRDAATYCDRTEMPLFAAIVRRCLAKLIGGAEGHQTMAHAESWMAEGKAKLVDLDRVTALYLPGFAPRGLKRPPKKQ
jgi:hypothetical protein